MKNKFEAYSRLLNKSLYKSLYILTQLIVILVAVYYTVITANLLIIVATVAVVLLINLFVFMILPQIISKILNNRTIDNLTNQDFESQCQLDVLPNCSVQEQLTYGDEELKTGNNQFKKF